ncbi:MAG: helix-turn-helix transcriptional regulator [Lachnospiraceae bacterium]|nr:helix-turn-helix transcriptional regulator [Lachnospiraceae bacterium]
MSELYKYLKLLREKKCISQKELAEELGISPASYNLYEKGKREPNIDMIEKIANYFNVSPSYLMGWDEKYQKLDDKIDNILKKLSDEELLQEEVSNYVKELEKYMQKQNDIEHIQEQFYNSYFKSNTLISGNDDFTPEELAKIEEFANFIKSQRKKD